MQPPSGMVLIRAPLISPGRVPIKEPIEPLPLRLMSGIGGGKRYPHIGHLRGGDTKPRRRINRYPVSRQVTPRMKRHSGGSSTDIHPTKEPLAINHPRNHRHGQGILKAPPRRERRWSVLQRGWGKQHRKLLKQRGSPIHPLTFPSRVDKQAELLGKKMRNKVFNSPRWIS